MLSQSSGGLSAPAHHLDCLEYVLRLVVVGIAQVGGPLLIAVHLRQHLGKRRQRFYARVPVLRVGAGRNLVRGGVALRLPPVVGIRDLTGVGRRGHDLRHQRVRIKCDRGHELFQLHRIERLSRSRRLAITLLRIRLTGIRIRPLRVRLLSIVRLRLGLLIGRVLSVVLIVLRPSLIAGLAFAARKVSLVLSRRRRTTTASASKPLSWRAAFFAVLAAAAARQGEVSGGRENLAARGAYRCIWGFIFPFSVRRKTARTRRNRYSKADADWFYDLDA